MLYRTLFPRDLLAQLDRLQRDFHHIDRSPSIRGGGQGGFPALNVGTTPQAVEIYAFAPGVDPASLDVQIERGVLTLSGERAPDLPQGDRKAAVHIAERFAGSFRRVVSLPDDIDAGAVSARYRDGVLHVSVPRRAPEQPRKIDIQ